MITISFCRITCEVLFSISTHDVIYLALLYVSTCATGLTMPPGTRRMSKSMPPLVVDDQSRCCRGGPLGPSESSSPHDTPVHHDPVSEASVPSEPSTPHTPHTPSSVGNVYLVIMSNAYSFAL